MSIINSIDSSHQPVADPSNAQTDSKTHTPHATLLAHTAPAHTSAHMAHTCNPIARGESHHAHHFSARLPKLEIPVFSGEALEWQPFWDCFAAFLGLLCSCH